MATARSGSRLARWWDAALAGVMALGNYLVSAPRGVLLDDDGYFVLAAWSGGVAHPPGYPLYTLLAGLFAQLPVGTPAWRVHAASALFAALACAVCWQLVRGMTDSRAAAWVAALCLGFSATFWSQAIIADVYSLNALLFVTLLYLCLDTTQGDRPAPTRSSGLCIAFLFGLALANHWPLTLLSAPALVVAAWPRRRLLAPRPLLLVLPLLAGLLPYAWMVYRSHVAEFAFLGPLQGPGDVWDYVSRRLYADVDRGEFAAWTDKLRYAGFALQETARQFSLPATLLVAAGFIGQWSVWPRAWCWSLTLGFAGSTFLLAALLGFDWDLLHRNTFSVYPLPAFAATALWLGLGFRLLVKTAVRLVRERASELVIQAALGVLLVGTTWLQQAPGSYRADDRWAADFAAAVLDGLPPRATLFIYGDFAVGPVAYAHYVEGRRPDVTLLSPVGQFLPQRLFAARDARTARAVAAIDDYLARARGPVYYNLVLPHRFGVIRHGLLDEVARELPPGRGEARLSPQVDRFFLQMLDRGVPRDASQSIHYRQLAALYCRTLALLAPGPGPDPAGQRLGRYCGSFHGLLARAEARIVAGDRDTALQLLAMAAGRTGEAVTAHDLATLARLLEQARRAPGA